MMKRDDALRLVARYHPDGIVVPVYQTAFDWMAIRPHPLNYLGVGAMGQASSHGLGLALGCPDETVVVLDGDGSLLMNLGTLVTVAQAAPRNMIHFVSFNGIYEVNGEYPLPGRETLDFCGMAKAAGYRRTYAFSTIDDLGGGLPEVFDGDGPIFVSMEVETGVAYPRDFSLIHCADLRRQFGEALRQRRTSKRRHSPR